MQHHALLAAVALILAACGGSSQGDGSSGITGHAVAGPQCPVQIQGSPCPDAPWQGTVVATDASTGDEFTVETDADGRFRLALEPGTYELSIRSDTSPPFAKPQQVTVHAAAFTDVTLTVDTGIR
jgi:hypothetical protein